MNKAFSLVGAAVALSGVTLAQGADDCANAQVIMGLGPHSYDNQAATKDGANDCDGQPARKDVWFRWTAPMTGGYVFSNCASSTMATRVVAYDLQACPPTNPIACSAVGCSDPYTHFSFPTVGGQDYLIRVGSKNFGQSGTGTFMFLFDKCYGIPDDGFEDNDTCDTAAPVGNGSFPNLKVHKKDIDWYSIDVADGDTLSVDVLFSHGAGNIETWLYQGCGGALLDNGGSVTDDENVTWTNNTGACVTTMHSVILWDSDLKNECNVYTMNVTGASPPGTCSGGSDIGTNYCTPSVPNSTGQSATISAFGSDMVVDNDVTLTADLLPANQFGMFLNSMTQGFIQNPGGSQGNLCLKGSIGRYNRAGEIKGSGAGGTISLVLDLTDTPQPTGSVSIMAGETWNFQTWYRDVGGNSNFTDGIEIMFL